MAGICLALFLASLALLQSESVHIPFSNSKRTAGVTTKMVSSTELSADEQLWVTKLNNTEYGQSHLFPHDASVHDLKRLIAQLDKADKALHGGILSYFKRARQLLADGMAGKSSFDVCTPIVPDGERLEVGTAEYRDAEIEGLEQISKTCFVLVAGGLGERLGYPDIKIVLPSETSTMTSFIELYIQQILAFQNYATEKLGRPVTLPFALMTSDDTHNRTLEVLASNNYFGMDPNQVTIVKQEKVPALVDNDARTAVKKDDPFVLETKPHGHGDVHTLLLQAGLPKLWAEQGYKWLVFFQDTNSLIFRCIPAVIGVSSSRSFVMNSVTIPRMPGEAVGAITRLLFPDGTNTTLNVEYNILDPLLRKTGDRQGDVPDPDTGFSRFPGNINVFVVDIPRYAEVLSESGGIIPEFVNPKYADNTKTKFKSPTRLECMMQDYPKLLKSDDKVGFTQLDRWISFSTVKSQLTDAAAKAALDLPSESGFSGESDHYYAGARLLAMAAKAVGAKEVWIPEPVPMTFSNVAYQLGPRVVLKPSFGVSFEQIKERLRNMRNKTLRISANSTLILDGNVQLGGLDLDGTLIATARNGAQLSISDLSVKNRGWIVREVGEFEQVEPQIRIRGFEINKHEQTVLESA